MDMECWEIFFWILFYFWYAFVFMAMIFLAKECVMNLYHVYELEELLGEERQRIAADFGCDLKSYVLLVNQTSAVNQHGMWQ